MVHDWLHHHILLDKYLVNSYNSHVVISKQIHKYNLVCKDFLPYMHEQINLSFQPEHTFGDKLRYFVLILKSYDGY